MDVTEKVAIDHGLKKEEYKKAAEKRLTKQIAKFFHAYINIYT